MMTNRDVCFDKFIGAMVNFEKLLKIIEETVFQNSFNLSNLSHVDLELTQLN